MQISNQNLSLTKKHPTFGVRKTDSIQSFINEIRTTNPNLGNIARLPIVQKMKESDTFEQLQEKANADKNMFENKHSFNIANKKGFIYLINSICIKIMQELKTLGETVGKFIVQVEDENGNKKENDIVSAFRIRLKNKKYYTGNLEKIKKYYKDNKDKIKGYQKEYYKNNSEKMKKYEKEYYKNNSEKMKEYQEKYRKNNSEDIKTKKKNYYETYKDKILERQRKYRETHKDEIRERKRNYYETHKNEILEYQRKYRQKNSEKIKINFMLPETWQFEDLQSDLKPQTSFQQEQTDYVYFMPQTSWQLEELQSELKPQTSLPQEQTDYGFIPQIPWPQERTDFELKPKTSWEQGQKDFEPILPNFQQDPEDDFML